MEIILYTQEHCPMCKAVHMQLDKLEVEYENIVIDDNNRKEYIEKGIKTTPVLIIDEKTFVGQTIKDGIHELRNNKDKTLSSIS